MRRHIKSARIFGCLISLASSGFVKTLTKVYLADTARNPSQSFVRDREFLVPQLGNLESSLVRFGLGCLDSLYHGRHMDSLG